MKEPGVCTSAKNNVLPNSSSNCQSPQTPAIDVSKTEAGLNTIQIDVSQMTSQECPRHQPMIAYFVKTSMMLNQQTS